MDVCIPQTEGGQKKVLDPLKLELEIAVSYPVDAGT